MIWAEALALLAVADRAEPDEIRGVHVIRCLAVVAILGCFSSCQRRTEQSSPPLPAQAQPSPSHPATSNQIAAPTDAAVAIAHPDASTSDARVQAAGSLRPLTSGKLVRLDNVGAESTWLEIRVPPRFKVTVTELTEEKLPRATIKGPQIRIEVWTPETGFSSLSKQKQEVKDWNPTAVFDRSEEIPNGNLMIYHAPDPTTQAVKYHANVDRPKLGISCASAPDSLPQAELAISICLSLHDRNDI